MEKSNFLQCYFQDDVKDIFFKGRLTSPGHVEGAVAVAVVASCRSGRSCRPGRNASQKVILKAQI